MNRLIGDRLRTARMLAGFSQEDAAASLQVSQKTISGWERGRSFPRPELFQRVCILYGVTPNYVYLMDASPQRILQCPPDGHLRCKAMQERAWATAI